MSILNEIFAGHSNLAGRFFTFSTLNISCHSLLACRVSAERSAVNHMSFLLYVTCCFSLAAFNILSLCLICVLMCFSLGSSCRRLSVLLGLEWLFPMLRKFSTIISSKMFSVPFFFSSSSGTPITQILVCLILSQRSLRLSSVLFTPFPLFCSSAVISTTLSSSSLIHSSACYSAIGSF